MLKALVMYGIDSGTYNNYNEMFDTIHAMRTRIMTSPVFIQPCPPYSESFDRKHFPSIPNLNPYVLRKCLLNLIC